MICCVLWIPLCRHEMRYDWETPKDFYEILNKEFHFTLDPCSKIEGNQKITYKDNGLAVNWSDHIVFVNPPYDRTLPQWVRKSYFSAQQGATVVMLLRSGSTDTAWWHEYIMFSSEIRFIRNRLSFVLDGKPSRANHASLLVIFFPFCTGPPKIKSML